MYNTRLDGLTEYPFQRLAALLAGVEPGVGMLASSACSRAFATYSASIHAAVALIVMEEIGRAHV